METTTTDTGAQTARRYLRLLGSIVIWIIVVIDAWYLWPVALGGNTSLVIVSGSSMEPTYYAGDLVIARDIEPAIGDVIVYAPETLGGSQIVHRIIGGDAEAGWELQGDNNDFIDPFYPTADEVNGVVLVHYTNLGQITALLLNPLVWAFVLIFAIGLLLWFSDDDCEEDDDAEDDELPEGTDGPESVEEPSKAPVLAKADQDLAPLGAGETR